jgi:sulfatase maturation enzyme AslB (radical SAM superfamily)
MNISLTKDTLKSNIQTFSPNELLKEKYDITVDDSTFCILPFTHFSTTTNGEVRLCCRSKKIWNINEKLLLEKAPDTVMKTGIFTLKELWLGKEYNKVREDLVTGVRNSKCEACWKLEDVGMISLRQDLNVLRLPEMHHLVKHWFTNKQAAWEVPVIELKLSNLCNLKCRMCWPKDSTPWVKDWPKVSHFFEPSERDYIQTIMDANNMYRNPLLNLFESNSKFMQDLAEILDKVTLLQFAGGEPLLDPLHFKILETIPDPSKVMLQYSTNLTELEFKKGRNVLDIWKKFKGVKLVISIDGHRELNSKIRQGSNWDDIKRNIQLTKEILGDKLMDICASTCISAMNIEELPETIDAIENELQLRWYTSRVKDPKFLHGNVIPVDRLLIAKEKLTEKRKSRNENQSVRHIDDSIIWISECIANNKSDKFYETFVAYNKILDEGKE